MEEPREDDDDEHWHDSADLTPQFWERDGKNPRAAMTLSLPIHIIERKSDGNNNPPTSKSTTVKRTIKNVLSSILNWKNSKGLPKGSREYYAARESLGEEMRAFRRDTMPRLMQRHASVKGPEGRDEQREFSAFIGSPKQKSLVARDEPSIATIHPVYGSCSQRRSWHKQDFPDIDEKPELVYGSIKVEPPTPPPRADHLSSPAPSEIHLLRPSKVKELQKRIESYSQVQLRKSPASNNGDSIVYDVPRSNRKVDSEDAAEARIARRITPPGEYANVSGIIGAHDHDKRLRCTAFTTF